MKRLALLTLSVWIWTTPVVGQAPYRDIPFVAPPGDLQAVNGVIRVPTGPGWGVTIDPVWLAKSETLTGLP